MLPSQNLRAGGRSSPFDPVNADGQLSLPEAKSARLHAIRWSTFPLVLVFNPQGHSRKPLGLGRLQMQGALEMQNPGWKSRANENGPQLVAALERLLSYPQNQDSTDPKLCAAIRRAQQLVDEIRGPRIDPPRPTQSRRRS